jgi:hypothetical protein
VKAGPEWTDEIELIDAFGRIMDERGGFAMPALRSSAGGEGAFEA